MRTFKVAVALGILILLGLAGYAYFGDMSSDPAEMRMPVTLDLTAGGAGQPPATTPDTASGDAAVPAATDENPPAEGTVPDDDFN